MARRLLIAGLNLILFMLMVSTHLYAQKLPKLTHHMSAEEAKLKHLIGKDFVRTDPPEGPVRNIAEFDAMEGVLIRYPFGINYTLIAALSDHTIVTTIVESSSQQSYVLSEYESNGVNTANCNFLIASSDSYWTRDYGPWYIAFGDDQIGIVDFPYNRPRPQDDLIPQEMAGFLGIDWFAMDIIHTGGNYMTDGYGISASSDLVLEENPSLSQQDILEITGEYLGLSEYHILPDPNNTYIDHIDCWGKYLGVDKVLIREVPSSHPQYDEIEETAQYFANALSAYGTLFRVFRVYTPGDEPYTNSLIVNNKVFVPITGSQWDDEALETYEEAMPGYEIEGFFGSWESTDALHCRTKGIADRNHVYIHHIPLTGDQPISDSYAIDAEITAYSGQGLNNDQIIAYYAVNGGVWNEIVMTYEGGKSFSALIPEQIEGSQIAYYIYAEDNAGNTSTHPIIGEPDPHTFFVGEQFFADIQVDTDEIISIVDEGTQHTEEFTINNNGQIELNYDITWNTAMFEVYETDVTDSPSASSYDYNTYTELGWTEFSVTETGTLGSCLVDFVWSTDNWAYEGSFHMESPAGTSLIIGSGLQNGNYSVELDGFAGEELMGTWKIWIEDTYGDGGHQATNINITFNKQIELPEWLSVSPHNGNIEPSGSQLIEVMLDATILEPGNYSGNINIASNDPDQPEIIIPVDLTVDDVSGMEDQLALEENAFVYPNPFKDHLFIKIPLSEVMMSVSIYDAGGQMITSWNIDGSLDSKFEIRWDGSDIRGNTVERGLYLIKIESSTFTKTIKVLRF